MKENHLLEGSVLKSILIVAIPVTFANIFQSIYLLIDMFWLGRLGSKAVAAVSLSFPIIFFLSTMMVGFSMAGAILISQYNGRRDKKRVLEVVEHLMLFMLVVGIVLGVIGYFSSQTIISYLADDPDIVADAVSYLRISFLAFVATLLYSISQSSLQGIGEVKIPTLIVLATVFLNFVLDPLFMNGWGFVKGYGVAGVAFATFITEYLSAFAGLFYVSRKKYIDMKLGAIKIKKRVFKKVLGLGFPLSLELSSFSFSMVLMTFVVAVFGTLAVAAYGVSIRILSFVMIPAIGLSISTTLLVGNNIGGRKYFRAQRIFKTSAKTGFWTLFVFGVLLFVFAEPVCAFFVPGQNLLIKEASYFLRVVSITLGFVGFQAVIVGALKGAGRAKTSLFIVFLNTALIFVIGYFLSLVFHFGTKGVWFAYPLANTIGFLISLYFYFDRSWIKEIID